jgi:hypothetical protein
MIPDGARKLHSTSPVLASTVLNQRSIVLALDATTGDLK